MKKPVVREATTGRAGMQLACRAHLRGICIEPSRTRPPAVFGFNDQLRPQPARGSNHPGIRTPFRVTAPFGITDTVAHRRRHLDTHELCPHPSTPDAQLTFGSHLAHPRRRRSTRRTSRSTWRSPTPGGAAQPHVAHLRRSTGRTGAQRGEPRLTWRSPTPRGAPQLTWRGVEGPPRELRSARWREGAPSDPTVRRVVREHPRRCSGVSWARRERRAERDIFVRSLATTVVLPPRQTRSASQKATRCQTRLRTRP